MKKLFFLFALTGLTSLLLTNSGCNPDEPVLVGPTLDFLSQSPLDGTNYYTADFTINDTATYVPFGLKAEKGSGDLKTLTITEDGTNVPVSRILMKNLRTGDVLTVNNPMLLLGDLVNGFEIEILIDVHDEYATHNYTFEVADVNDKTASQTVAITTEFGGTPIDMTLTGVLLNQAGPAGTGGLDLDTGNGTGTQPSDVDAEIKDNGIDLSQPVDQNWIRRISPMNGAEIRTPGANFPSDFDFATVATKEEIQAFFNDGEALPAENANSEPMSDVVEVGDIFFVLRDGRYYLLEVTDITITPSDNSDSYTFNIKY